MGEECKTMILKIIINKANNKNLTSGLENGIQVKYSLSMF